MSATEKKEINQELERKRITAVIASYQAYKVDSQRIVSFDIPGALDEIEEKLKPYMEGLDQRTLNQEDLDAIERIARLIEKKKESDAAIIKKDRAVRKELEEALEIFWDYKRKNPGLSGTERHEAILKLGGELEDLYKSGLLLGDKHFEAIKELLRKIDLLSGYFLFFLAVTSVAVILFVETSILFSTPMAFALLGLVVPLLLWEGIFLLTALKIAWDSKKYGLKEAAAREQVLYSRLALGFGLAAIVFSLPLLISPDLLFVVAVETVGSITGPWFLIGLIAVLVAIALPIIVAALFNIAQPDFGWEFFSSLRIGAAKKLVKRRDLALSSSSSLEIETFKVKEHKPIQPIAYTRGGVEKKFFLVLKDYLEVNREKLVAQETVDPLFSCPQAQFDVAVSKSGAYFWTSSVTALEYLLQKAAEDQRYYSGNYRFLTPQERWKECFAFDQAVQDCRNAAVNMTVLQPVVDALGQYKASFIEAAIRQGATYSRFHYGNGLLGWLEAGCSEKGFDLIRDYKEAEQISLAYKAILENISLKDLENLCKIFLQETGLSQEKVGTDKSWEEAHQKWNKLSMPERSVLQSFYAALDARIKELSLAAESTASTEMKSPSDTRDFVSSTALHDSAVALHLPGAAQRPTPLVPGGPASDAQSPRRSVDQSSG